MKVPYISQFPPSTFRGYCLPQCIRNRKRVLCNQVASSSEKKILILTLFVILRWIYEWWNCLGVFQTLKIFEEQENIHSVCIYANDAFHNRFCQGRKSSIEHYILGWCSLIQSSLRIQRRRFSLFRKAGGFFCTKVWAIKWPKLRPYCAQESWGIISVLNSPPDTQSSKT